MLLRLLLINVLNCVLIVKGLFRLTNVKCIEYDPAFATIPLCELKVIRRGVSAFNLNVTLHKVPVNNVSVRYKIYLKLITMITTYIRKFYFVFAIPDQF